MHYSLVKGASKLVGWFARKSRLTLLFPGDDLHMGVGEQKVEMHRDVSPQILQERLLLTEHGNTGHISKQGPTSLFITNIH